MLPEERVVIFPSVQEFAVKAWSLHSGGKVVKTFLGHKGTVIDIKILLNLGSKAHAILLITASLDATIRMWNYKVTGHYICSKRIRLKNVREYSGDITKVSLPSAS